MTANTSPHLTAEQAFGLARQHWPGDPPETVRQFQDRCARDTGPPFELVAGDNGRSVRRWSRASILEWSRSRYPPHVLGALEDRDRYRAELEWVHGLLDLSVDCDCYDTADSPEEHAEGCDHYIGWRIRRALDPPEHEEAP